MSLLTVRVPCSVQWTIQGVAGKANTYTITNVSSGLHLSFQKDTNEEGKDIYRVKAFTDGSNWSIDPRGGSFVLV
jgi:hypothetical protein